MAVVEPRGQSRVGHEQVGRRAVDWGERAQCGRERLVWVAATWVAAAWAREELAADAHGGKVVGGPACEDGIGQRWG